MDLWLRIGVFIYRVILYKAYHRVAFLDLRAEWKYQRSQELGNIKSEQREHNENFKHSVNILERSCLRNKDHVLEKGPYPGVREKQNRTRLALTKNETKLNRIKINNLFSRTNSNTL